MPCNTTKYVHCEQFTVIEGFKSRDSEYVIVCRKIVFPFFIKNKNKLRVILYL